MENTREDLVNELQIAIEMADNIRAKIDKLDSKNIIENLNRYKGKCYIDVNYDDTLIQVIYVFDIDENNFNTKSIQISYSSNGSYYSISNNNMFDPKKWNEEDLWNEITFDDFKMHYNNVDKFIQNSLNF